MSLKKWPEKSITLISILLIFFHFSVILGLIPIDLVWGGRVESTGDLVILEILSLSVVLFMLVLILAYDKRISVRFGSKTYRFFFWLYTILFGLNTLGNLAAINQLETLLFTPVTFLLFLAFLKLALVKEQRS